MRNFFSFLKLEFTRTWSLKYMAVFCLIFIILFYFTITSFQEYNTLPTKENIFKKNYEKIFQRLKNNESYGEFGLRILFLPSQQGILFSNGVLPTDSIGEINVVWMMDIISNLKGKNAEPDKTIVSISFSMLIIIILSILFLYYGYSGVKNKDFFRTVSSITNLKSKYFQYLLTRFISISFYVVVLNMLIMGTLAITGFKFSDLDIKAYCGYFLSLLIVLFIFFLIGSIIGNLKIKKNSWIVLVLSWIFLVFVIPPILISFSSGDYSNIYNMADADSEKMGIIDNFENNAAKQYGKRDKNNPQNGQKVIEGYWKNEFQEVEKVDQNFRNQKEHSIRKYQIASIFTPVSFYNMTALEAGSKGYENYLKFTDYVIKKRREFLRFWIDRVYYNDPKVMVNFINNNENIFHGQGALPSTFAAGAGVNMVYIIILFIISNALFHRSIFLVDKKNLKFREPVKTLIHQEKVQDIYVCKDGRFKNILFSMFSGFGDYLYKNGFEGKFFDQLGKIDFSLKTQDFVYICDPDELPPETKVRDLLTFFACLGRTKKEKRKMILEMPEISAIANRTIESLSNDEKCDVMLALISLIDKKIYLVYNIGSNSSWQYVVKTVKHLEKLSETAERVLYLTNKPDVEEEKRYPDSPQSEYARWLVGAQIVKNKLDNERTIKKESKD